MNGMRTLVFVLLCVVVALGVMPFAYHSDSSWDAETPDTSLEPLGSPLPDWQALDLAYYWAPSWLQDIDSHDYDADFITNFDFDWNWNPYDNWEHHNDLDENGHIKYLPYAYIYYWVVETETNWFIGYADFHPKDWSDVSSEFDNQHENDLEGCLLVIQKDGSAYGRFQLLITYAHYWFYSYHDDNSALSADVSSGEEDIDGHVHWEELTTWGQHVRLFVEPKGHGVWGDPDGDQWARGNWDFEWSGDWVRYVPASNQFEDAETPVLDANNRDDVKYQLKSVNELWAQRFDTSIFPFYGTIGGDDWEVNSPKAPWGWDNRDDEHRQGDLFLEPAELVYGYHTGLGDFSQTYLYTSYGSVFETFKPFETYTTYCHTWRVPGASRIRVHFSRLSPYQYALNTPELNDYLYLYAGSCEGVRSGTIAPEEWSWRWSGFGHDVWSDWIDGDTVGFWFEPRFWRFFTYNGIEADRVEYCPVNPSVRTLEPDVSCRSAILKGYLESTGDCSDPSSVQLSMYWCEWAGSFAPPPKWVNVEETSPLAMEEPGFFDIPITGLSPSTTYWCIAKAVGPGGTVTGKWRRFTTQELTPLAVTTNAASRIMVHTATLNGLLTSLGSASSVLVSFQWGRDTSHLNTTTPQTMTGTGAFSASISGLSGGTTYYFRAAGEGDGMAYGDIKPFTTPPDQVISVATAPATGVEATSATLEGNLISPGAASPVLTLFEWGLTADYGNETAAHTMDGIGAFTLPLNWLSPGTTYHFRAKAVSDATAYGKDETFTTPIPPTAVTEAATEIGEDSAALNGTLTDLGSASMVEVFFEYGDGIVGEVVDTYTVYQYPYPLISDGVNVWVANGGTENVVKLNASDGALLGTYTVGEGPCALAFDGANIWAANYWSNNVMKLRASDGALLGTYSVGTGPTALAFDGRNIWVANNQSNNVMKLRAYDGALLDTYSVGTGPAALAFDGRSVWVANNQGNNVMKLRASDGALLGTYPVGTGPAALAFDGANTWVANALSNDVTKLRASDGATLGTYAVGQYPVALTFDGANIWAANYSSDSVTRLRASDGATLGTYAVGDQPRGLIFDGEYVWVSNWLSNNVTKLRASPYWSDAWADTTFGAGPFSLVAAELLPGTTYHFRAKAGGGGSTYEGTSCGLDMTFTTGGTRPPTVTTSTATDIGKTEATLNGNLIQLGSAASVQVSFEWGSTSTYGNTTTQQTVTTSGSFDFDLSGLTPGTTYHFRAKALGDGSTYGDDFVFVTPLPTPPGVYTSWVTGVGETAATVYGGLTQLGTAASVQVSFEWGLTTDYGNSTTAQTLTAPGSFSFALSGLASGTTYYFRARASGDGTAYGAAGDFTTLSAAPPEVTTYGTLGTRGTLATLQGYLTNLGTASSVQVSFEWGLDIDYGNTTPSQSWGTTGNVFSFALSGLTPETTYHFRAKAVGDGTAYGADMFFTTISAVPPAVTTAAATEIRAGMAMLRGDLTTWGTALSVVWVSFEWGLTTSYGNTTMPQRQEDIGDFNFALSDLTPETTYHFRAKAVGDGIAYGDDMAFITLGGVPPAVTTIADPEAVLVRRATLNGNLIGLGSALVVQVSFEWGLTTDYGNTTTAQTMTAPSSFSFALSGLIPETTYHFRAKAVGDGTAYGDDMTFITKPMPLVVITFNAANVSTNSARINGSLLGLGAADSVTVSFEWGLTADYGNATAAQTMTSWGTFSFELGGLSPGTTYHFRAKALGQTTVYGDDTTFTTTTGTTPPSVTTDGATGLGTTCATLNGKLTSLGSAAAVQVFFEWGLTTSYGNTTTPQSREDTGEFSFALSELTPETIYHFRAKAVGDGTAFGDDMTFITSPWDINQDRKVDYRDLAMLGAHYGESPTPPYPAWDINQDGVIDYKDLAILGAHYGETH